MSTRYKFVDNCVVYFNTSTIAGWTDFFKREMYKIIFLDGVRNCQQNHSSKNICVGVNYQLFLYHL